MRDALFGGVELEVLDTMHGSVRSRPRPAVIHTGDFKGDVKIRHPNWAAGTARSSEA
jgi:hypothetical protein